jgi:hypothetical protein
MKHKYDPDEAAANWDSGLRALKRAFTALKKGMLQDAFIFYNVATSDLTYIEDMSLRSGAPDIEHQLEMLRMARYQVGRLIELALQDIEKEIKYTPVAKETVEAGSYLKLLDKEALP